MPTLEEDMPEVESRQIGDDTAERVTAKRVDEYDPGSEGEPGTYRIGIADFESLESRHVVRNVPIEAAQDVVDDVARAEEYHRERPEMARRVDENRASQDVTASYSEWAADPRRHDYPGVDTPVGVDGRATMFDWGALEHEMRDRAAEAASGEGRDFTKLRGPDELPALRSFDDLVGRTEGSTVYLEHTQLEDDPTYIARRTGSGEIALERPRFRDMDRPTGGTRPEHYDTETSTADELDLLGWIDEGLYKVKEPA